MCKVIPEIEDLKWTFKAVLNIHVLSHVGKLKVGASLGSWLSKTCMRNSMTVSFMRLHIQASAKAGEYTLFQSLN